VRDCRRSPQVLGGVKPGRYVTHLEGEDAEARMVEENILRDAVLLAIDGGIREAECLREYLALSQVSRMNSAKETL
jgi:hypothetical protein